MTPAQHLALGALITAVLALAVALIALWVSVTS
jgi:hypothetical protein